MVTALLRALGFDDEGDAGAGQDRAPVGAGQDRVGVGAASADVDQNTLPGLTPAQARAFCGPAAVLDLIQQYGNHIPATAVVQKAQERDPRTGRPYWQGEMGGPQEFANLLDEFGFAPQQISLAGAGAADGWRQVQTALRNGQRVAIDTPQHYYQAESIDDAGNIRLGDSVGRSRTVQSPEDITRLGYGAPRTAITATPRDPQQGPPPGQPAPGPASIQRLAMQAGADDELAEIMAAGAQAESGARPQAGLENARLLRAGQPVPSREGDSGHSVGIYQMHDRGHGAGMSAEERADPATATAAMLPHYRDAYAAAQARGKTGEELAIVTYLGAERPGDPLAPARFRAAYQEVTRQSAQGNELQVGGGYAPPTGTAGAANAGGAPNPVQQAWDASAPLRQQLMANLGGAAEAVGGAVAGLGATPAYAQTSGPAGPPPGPTPQVQQPPPVPRRGATGSVPGGPYPSVPDEPLAAPARPPETLPINMRPPAPTAAPPPPAAPAPTDYGPGGFAGAAAAAAGPPRPVMQPQGPPPADMPRPPAAGTAPAAGIAETTPPAPAGLPPDTETEHWDNNIRAWVPKTPSTTFPGGGRYRIAPGVETATDERGNPAPNPPGTPVEYVPIQAGYYNTPQGRQYWDSTTQQWHQPTGQGAQQQGAQTHDMGGGLRFRQPDPSSPNGTWMFTDPNTGAVREQAGSLNDQTLPAGLTQPSGEVPETAAQRLAREQGQANRGTLSAYEQSQATQAQANAAQSAAADERRYSQMTAYEAAQRAADDAKTNYLSGIPTPVGGRLYGRDPNNPDMNAPAVDLGPVPETPRDQAATAASQAQTRATQAGLHDPYTVGPYTYQRQFDEQGNPTDPLNLGLTPPTQEQQDLSAEKRYEFGNLSAQQQAAQQESQANRAQSASEFSQSLAEKQSEADKPYQQMTKAQQAQNAIEQQRLGLDQAKASNQLETLPRGGIMRVNPFTGQSSLINAPEPEDIKMVGSQIYIPGGRQVSMLGQQISGGPNPYAGWGGGGGGGWGGAPSGGFGWQPPQQQRQGWMGQGY